MLFAKLNIDKSRNKKNKQKKEYVGCSNIEPGQRNIFLGFEHQSCWH